MRRGIVQYEAALYSSRSSVAVNTTALHTIASGHIVNNNTIAQVRTFIEVHTRTASMRHILIGYKSMANRKSVPVRLLILYVIGIFLYITGIFPRGAFCFTWTFYTMRMR